MPGIFEFYQNRICATRNYPFYSARGILLTLIRCASYDGCLTLSERIIIIDNAISELNLRERKET